MFGIRRDRNQVVLFAQNLENLAVEVQAKQPCAIDEETHFVFTVSVFREKLGAQNVALLMVGTHADDIPALIALFGHQLVDFVLVGRDNLLGLRIAAQFAVGLPALEAYVDFFNSVAMSFPSRLSQIGAEGSLSLNIVNALIANSWSVGSDNHDLIKTVNLLVIALFVRLVADKLAGQPTGFARSVKLLTDVG